MADVVMAGAFEARDSATFDSPDRKPGFVRGRKTHALDLMGLGVLRGG